MSQPYGPPISREAARHAATAALAEAARNNWTMVAAIVDPGGHLVHLERMDDVQIGSVVVAQTKARSAALFKRPTKALQDALAAGGEGLRVLALEGAVPVEGGVPLDFVDGKIVGAIGLSGGTERTGWSVRERRRRRDCRQVLAATLTVCPGGEGTPQSTTVSDDIPFLNSVSEGSSVRALLKV